MSLTNSLAATVFKVAVAFFFFWHHAHADLNIESFVWLEDSQQWQASNTRPDSLSINQKNYRLKLVIHDPKNANSTGFVEILNPHLSHIDVSNSAEETIASFDNRQAFTSRLINYRRFVVPFTLTDNNATIFLDIQQSYRQKLQFKLWEQADFIHKANKELLLFGLIYGCLLMIAIYALFVYFALHEKNHLWFCFFVALSSVFISFHEGHFSQFIFANATWPQHIIFAITCASLCISFSLFSFYFLDLRLYHPIKAKIILAAGFIAATIFVITGFYKGHFIFSQFSLATLLALYAVATAVSLFIWHKGITNAGFFTLAMFFCCLGLLIEFITEISFKHTYYLPVSYSSVGNLAMLFVFAFALAYRMRVLNKEKLEASIKLIKAMEDKSKSSVEIYKAKLSEVKLQQEAQAALAKSQAKYDILSSMSHEIRTPMSSIIGSAELLGDTKLNESQESYVASVKSASSHLLNVINGLLSYSKIESGSLDLEARTFQLNKLMDDCCNVFALNAQERQIRFNAYVKSGTPLQLKGDVEKIRQITLNLLNDISHVTGVDSILLYSQSTGKTSINSVEIAFNIQAHGEDIDQTDVEQWLQRFNQDNEALDNNHAFNRKFNKQLLELMHGDISSKKTEHGIEIVYSMRLLLPNEKQDGNKRNHNLLQDHNILLLHNHQDTCQRIKDLCDTWQASCTVCNDEKTFCDTLFSNEKIYHALLVEAEYLTPELQLYIRKSNLENNFVSPVIMLADSQKNTLIEEEMKKRAIQRVLPSPFMTSTFYEALVNTMGLQEKTCETTPEHALNILIAEDNPVNAMVLKGMLKKMHINATIVSNGQKAFEQAQLHHYDIIFMDFEMPELNGYETTAAIRSFEHDNDKQTKSIIIGLSAHADKEYKIKAEESGMNDFILKPINQADLEQLLQQHTESDSTS